MLRSRGRHRDVGECLSQEPGGSDRHLPLFQCHYLLLVYRPYPTLRSICVIHTHARTHARARAHTHTHTHTHEYARTHECVYARMHACTHARMHAYTRTLSPPPRLRCSKMWRRILLYTHTHTLSLSLTHSLSLSLSLSHTHTHTHTGLKNVITVAAGFMATGCWLRSGDAFSWYILLSVRVYFWV
jgi:hypothetical protein